MTNLETSTQVVIPAPFRMTLPDVGLPDRVSLILEYNPFTYTILFWGLSDTPTTSTHDEIARAVSRICLQATDNRYMDLCI